MVHLKHTTGSGSLVQWLVTVMNYSTSKQVEVQHFVRFKKQLKCQMSH